MYNLSCSRRTPRRLNKRSAVAFWSLMMYSGSCVWTAAFWTLIGHLEYHYITIFGVSHGTYTALDMEKISGCLHYYEHDPASIWGWHMLERYNRSNALTRLFRTANRIVFSILSKRRCHHQHSLYVEPAMMLLKYDEYYLGLSCSEWK